MKSVSGIIAKRWERDELAFLPAALEIVETPPSPIGRAISATIILALCLAIAWASFGQIDIVASATGKVIPTGRIKVLQPLENGVIKAIHVSDGQAVKQGQLLIELDPTVSTSERTHIEQDLLAAQLDVARLRAALADGPDPLADFAPPKGATPNLIATQTQLLLSQVNEHRAKLAALDGQKAQKESELATINATINKLQAIIPSIQERIDLRRGLGDYGTKLSYYETLQLLIEHQQEVNVQKSRYQEAQSAIAAITETRKQAGSEYRRTLFSELAQAQQKADGFTQDLSKADQKLRLTALTAPIDGVVQQLAVHTVGGVVTAAQVLLAVVPVDSRLEIEANVSNRDIGFVRVGQPAEIKVDTFNFTRYGLLHGKVTSVSQDAVTREKPPEKPSDNQAGSQTGSSEPKGQELVYTARISLDETQLPVEGKMVNLQPGMAVTVEIKTGSRTVMSYLLSPLLRSQQESLRER